MPDRENVIDNLEQNIRWIEEIECHQFPGWANVTMAMRDAAELLKEQKPVKPIIKTQELNGEIIKYYGCGICKTPLPKTFRFCQMCGRKVKWDADP